MARSTAAFAFPAVAAGLLAAAVYVRMRFLRKLAHIPGPPYTFLLGNLAQLKGPPAFPFAFFTQRHLFLRALHARYGPVVRIVLPAGRGALVFFAEAEPMVEPFFQNAAVFSRRPSSPKVMELGLLAVPTGDLSRMHRAALSPAFSTRALRHHAFTLNRHASELCAYLLAASGGGTSDVEIHKPLCATTMDGEAARTRCGCAQERQRTVRTVRTLPTPACHRPDSIPAGLVPLQRWWRTRCLPARAPACLLRSPRQPARIQ